MNRLLALRLVSSLIVVGSLYFAGFAYWQSNSTLFTDDGALSFAVGRAILGGEFPLAGPPASLAGRHFGPLSFYVDALALLLAGNNPETAILILSTFKSVAIFSLWTAACRFTGAYGVVSGPMMAVTIITGMWWWVIRVPWHSNFLLLPSSLFVLTSAAALKFGARYLPQTIFVASLLLSSHLAVIPLVCAVLAVVLIKVLNDWRQGRCQLPTKARCSLFLIGAALVWLPTAVFEIRYPGASPFAALLEKSSRYRRPAGIDDALESILLFFRRYTFGDTTLQEFLPQGGTALLTISALATIGLWWLTTRGEDSLSRRKESNPTNSQGNNWIFAALGAAILLYAIALKRLPSPIGLHLLSSMIPFVFFSLSILLNRVELQFRSSLISKHEPATSFIALLLLAPILLSLSLCLISSLPRYRGKLFLKVSTMQHARETYGLIAGDLDAQDFILDISGPENRREGAVYYLAGPLHDYQISGSRKLLEMPSFQRDTPIKPKVLFELSCEQDSSRRRSNEQWTNTQQIKTDSCSTCGSCTLAKSYRQD